MGVTTNDKDTPEQSCRFELMDRKNAPKYIFSMFEAFCEDIKLDSGILMSDMEKFFEEAVVYSFTPHSLTLYWAFLSRCSTGGGPLP